MLVLPLIVLPTSASHVNTTAGSVSWVTFADHHAWGNWLNRLFTVMCDVRLRTSTSQPLRPDSLPYGICVEKQFRLSGLIVDTSIIFHGINLTVANHCERRA